MARSSPPDRPSVESRQACEADFEFAARWVTGRTHHYPNEAGRRTRQRCRFQWQAMLLPPRHLRPESRCSAPEMPSRTASNEVRSLARHCAAPTSSVRSSWRPDRSPRSRRHRSNRRHSMVDHGELGRIKVLLDSDQRRGTQSGMAKPTLKPITLSSPPARANQGDLRREDHATAKVAGRHR